MIFHQVEIVHGTGNVEIGVRIKPIDKINALIAEVALYLKIRVKAVCQIIPVL